MLPKKKQLSGAEKRRKKKESDLKILALKGSLNNFFTSSSNVDVSLISFLFEVIMSYYFHFAIFLVPLFFMESVRIWLLLFSMESFELL